MSNAPITVQVDDRVRLLAAVLSQTTWPFQEQDLKPHDVHAHAKETRKMLVDLEEHPAVETLQDLLETVRSLDIIFLVTKYLNWPDLAVIRPLPEWVPGEWPEQLRDFLTKSDLQTLWDDNQAMWEEAQVQAREALNQGKPVAFMSQFFGYLGDLGLVFEPNLLYPTDSTVGIKRDGSLVCICPPRIAWGHNPPWPYNDDPAATTADAMLTYARVLLWKYMATHPKESNIARQSKLPVPNTFRAKHPDWFEQFAVLFTHGMTAIYLEETFSKSEAASFSMFAQKAHGFDVMPSVIEVLSRYLQGKKEGRFTEFIEYMPIFSKTMSIAQSLGKT